MKKNNFRKFTNKKYDRHKNEFKQQTQYKPTKIICNSFADLVAKLHIINEKRGNKKLNLRYQNTKVQKKKMFRKKEKISYHRLNPFQKIKREAQYTLKDILTYNRIEVYRVPKYRGYRKKLALPYIRFYKQIKKKYVKPYVKFLEKRKNKKFNYGIRNAYEKHKYIKKIGKKLRLKTVINTNKTYIKIKKKIASMIKSIKRIKWRFLGNDLYYESVVNPSRALIKARNKE